MIQAAQPDWRILYAHSDVTLALDPFHVRSAWTDPLHGRPTRIDITLENREGLFSGPFMPAKGDDLGFQIGYKNGPLQGLWPGGSFTLDEFELTGPPDQVIVRGLGSNVKKAQREIRSRAFEGAKLQDVVSRVAKSLEMNWVGEMPNISFDRVTQNQETDLDFLRRLAESYGCVLRVEDGTLVFHRLDLVLKDGLEVVVERSNVIRYSIRSKTADQPRGFVSRYWDPARKDQFKPLTSKPTLITIKKLPAPSNKLTPEGRLVLDSGRVDIGKILDRVENSAQAQARMDAALLRANMGAAAGVIEVLGDPRLRSGVTVNLTDDWLNLSGAYVVTMAKHTIGKDGYTTEIDIAKNPNRALKLSKSKHLPVHR